MGWGHCGFNHVIGKWMGYSYEGICPKCNTIIDHGLSYVCGGMHEGGTLGCGEYFCTKHLFYVSDPNEPSNFVQLCSECLSALQDAIRDDERRATEEAEI